MSACEHRWVERRNRGSTYVTCATCHQIPDVLAALRERDEVRAEVRRLRREAKAKDTALVEAEAALTNVWSDGEPEFRAYYSEIPRVLETIASFTNPKPKRATSARRK